MIYDVAKVQPGTTMRTPYVGITFPESMSRLTFFGTLSALPYPFAGVQLPVSPSIPWSASLVHEHIVYHRLHSYSWRPRRMYFRKVRGHGSVYAQTAIPLLPPRDRCEGLTFCKRNNRWRWYLS